MGCEIIHETIVRDIVDILSDIKDVKKTEFKNTSKSNSFKSITRASSNLTLVFPVIASRNLNIDTAAMVSKAIERKAVTMLQMLFSAITITDADNAIDYIKKFHSNIKIDNDINIDSFINTMDQLVTKESVRINDMELYKMARNDLKNLNYTLPDSISESSLQDYKVYSGIYFGNEKVLKEEKTPEIKDIEKKIIKGSMSKSKYSDAKDISNIAKNRNDLLTHQLLDSDVKKANELIPTMMIINFVSKDKDSHIPQQAVIGVKAKLYPVDSTDIINRIIIKNQDKNGFLKFIKATTREISFCRDFLFAIDKARLDALSQSRKGSSSKLWKILERRALKSRIKRHLGKVNDALAISTLVLSQEEVEYLMKNENINILNARTMQPIIESYNLMGVCIADESMEVAKFLFDTGDGIYEEVPFRQLERDSGNNEYKKIVNLMTKVAR